MRTGRMWFYTLFCVLSFLPSVASASGFGAGRVMDYLTRKPIEGAIVTGENEIIRTDSDGMFMLKNAADKIGIRAYGYARGEQALPAPGATAPLNIYLRPFVPKALYLTYYGIGDRSLRESALNLMKETELNALVIDVKGDRGVITYKSSIPLVSEVGAQKQVIVKDIRGLLQSLKERGIYAIARIVVFKDNVLGTARPDLAVRTQDGRVWRDRENLIWVDPSKKEVWDYNIHIAVEAAQNGFDEIQFDYVRFPDRKGLAFSVPNTEKNRVKNISGFLMEAQKRLAPYNIFVAADIFGYVSWNLDDTQIGQRLDAIFPCVDYVSLMLYPSGFQFGIPGYRNPVAHPYEIVALSLKRARERTKIPAVRFRPWLQAFKDYAFDRRYFYGPEIRSQIRAAEEFGSAGWMLWNPRNLYRADGLKKEPVSKDNTRQDGPKG
ncbi:MAG TPA: putative glycoside hydrolase [Thermodesulfovibrionales bacterium]|nr:putative glycoside hydrolase [Thermodesulfovibrionales bacterium]